MHEGGRVTSQALVQQLAVLRARHGGNPSLGCFPQAAQTVHRDLGWQVQHHWSGHVQFCVRGKFCVRGPTPPSATRPQLKIMMSLIRRNKSGTPFLTVLYTWSSSEAA